jgi:hypothetical protein
VIIGVKVIDYVILSSQLPLSETKIEFKNRRDVQKMIYNGVYLIM